MIEFKRKFIFFAYKRLRNLRLPFSSGRLLLVRLDAIGDYVLFRNYIQALKEDSKWGKYKLTLLGNIQFKDLAEGLDRAWIDEFIWVNPGLIREYYNRFFLILKLKSKRYDVALNAMHSRLKWQDELLYQSGSKYLIGSEGDDIQFSSALEKEESDRLYNQLIPSLSIHHFEYLRNGFFFTGLLNKEVNTVLSIDVKRSSLLNYANYNILIFPGAGAAFRQWSPDYFISVARLLKENCKDRHIHFYILGGGSDQPIAEAMLKQEIDDMTDLTGKTNLMELVELIKGADLILSNETSAVHIAAATNTTAICISNGNHFGRFNPYPKIISDKIVTVYSFEDFYATDGVLKRELIEKFKYSSDLEINLISSNKVYQAILKVIK